MEGTYSLVHLLRKAVHLLGNLLLESGKIRSGSSDLLGKASLHISKSALKLLGVSEDGS